MNNLLKLYKFEPNFVPITKTPWGGMQIPILKKKYLSNIIQKTPNRIGESIEGQVDSLLLKWIDATEPLSVQIHPKNSNPLLKPGECGKPEAWFVYNLLNPTPLYLGFKDGYSKEEIENCLFSENPTECLHSFIPKKNDYISIPTGCVHALGAGILIAEPQQIVPHKEGKTWRIFDWNRAYNEKGEREINGSPRELHLQEALSAIDWDLPRGEAIEKILVQNLKHKDKFLGNAQNPFCVQLYSEPGIFNFKSFPSHSFSFITVFSGNVNISNHQYNLKLTGGESGFILFSSNDYQIDVSQKFGEVPCVLIFSLNAEQKSNPL